MLSCKDMCKISRVKAPAKTKQQQPTTTNVKTVEKDADSFHFHVKETTTKPAK